MRLVDSRGDGHAIDFHIPGVPLEVLRDYCANFAKVGVGYYPNSRFVHLDVRESNGRWTDLSRPGEAPVRNRESAARSDAEGSHEEELGEVDAVDG